MSVTLENIEKIIDRTKVSYKEAKVMLEACDGDVVEAIIRIEQNSSKTAEDAKKEKQESFDAKKNAFESQLKFWGHQGMKVLKKMMRIKLIWKKDDKAVLELPLLIVAIIALWTLPLSIIVLVVPFFFGIKLQIHRENGNVTDVDAWIKNRTNTNTKNQ